MDQRDAQGLGFFGEDAGRRGIDREGHLGLVLGLVDSSMGRRVDDQPRAMAAHLLADLLGVGQVELVATEHDQFTQALEPLLQLAGNLAVLAGDEDFQGFVHGNSSASSRGLPFWSLADSCGGSVSCQSIASVGSFHRMQRSALGW